MTARNEYVGDSDIQGIMNSYMKNIADQERAEMRFHNDVFSDIKREEDFLKHYNDKLVKAYQDIDRLHGKPSARTAEEILQILGDRERENFIISPAVLDPLVRAYEQKHDILEDEVVNLQGDIKRVTAMVELLIDENTKLRDHLTRRNRETASLLETLGLNDGETLVKMRQQIEILEEENKVLAQHLEETKSLKDVGGVRMEELLDERDKMKHIIKKLRIDLEENKLIAKNISEQSKITDDNHRDLSLKLQNEMKSRMNKEIELEKVKLENNTLSKEMERLQTFNNELLQTQQSFEKSQSEELSKLRMENQEMLRNLNSKINEQKKLQSLFDFKKDDEALNLKNLTNEKKRNNELFEENNQLKMRLREVMQSQNQYQDSLVKLKSQVEEQRLELQEKQLQVERLGSGKVDGSLNKKYNDMKKYYDDRVHNLETELNSYKAILENVYDEPHRNSTHMGLGLEEY